MDVNSLKYERLGALCRFEAEVKSATAIQPEFHLRFDFHGDVVPSEPVGDPWLAAVLVPAMFAGEDVFINAPVSRGLLERAADAQVMLRSWFPGVLREVRMKSAAVVEDTSKPAGGVACFFSGGVDSWYTLLKHRQEVTSLITVKGFDLPYSDSTIWSGLVSANSSIAAELGKELILVETDCRDRLDPAYKVFAKPFHGDFWGECMHGASMAAVGLFLGSKIDKALIPGSMQYSFLPPWGSHPLLDPLWSNGQVKFVHDGCEHLRLEKLRAVAKSDLALRYLRVCPAYKPGRYNCCECEKCKRTMMTLRLFGALNRAPCFDLPLDLDSMEFFPLTPIYFPTYTEILEESRRAGDGDVERLVRVLIGQKRSNRREWHNLKIKASRIIPRWKRSINKRVNKLRGSPAR